MEIRGNSGVSVLCQSTKDSDKSVRENIILYEKSYNFKIFMQSQYSVVFPKKSKLVKQNSNDLLNSVIFNMSSYEYRLRTRNLDFHLAGNTKYRLRNFNISRLKQAKKQNSALTM